MPSDRIQTLTYADLHPANTFFAPRTTLEDTRWVLSSRFKLDSITGITSSLMGDMPLICHRAVVTPAALDLMKLAGLSPPRNLCSYSSETEAISLAEQRISHGERLVYIYPPLNCTDASDGYLIPIPVYGELNDKRRMSEFVDDNYLPNRQIVPSDRIGELKDQSPEFPVFVKAGVEGATGAGVDVKYCEDRMSWRKAIQWFESRQDELSGLVVEEGIDVQVCWCLGAAILDEGCEYLGGAIQLFDKPALQTGSRIDPEFPIPDEAIRIALAIADEAKRRAYRGIAGFDIGIDANNRLYVFDLNFRLNSCTSQLLVFNDATQRIGARVSQSWQIEKTGALSELLERLVPYVEAKVFIPFRMFDQEAFNECEPDCEAKCVITGMIVASSVLEIEALDTSMKRALQ